MTKEQANKCSIEESNLIKVKREIKEFGHKKQCSSEILRIFWSSVWDTVRSVTVGRRMKKNLFGQIENYFSDLTSILLEDGFSTDPCQASLELNSKSTKNMNSRDDQLILSIAIVSKLDYLYSIYLSKEEWRRRQKGQKVDYKFYTLCDSREKKSFSFDIFFCLSQT